MKTLNFTAEQLSNALSSDNFWLKTDSEEARIVAEATEAGFVHRGSHTQAHWTKAGIDWHYASLKGKKFVAKQDTEILYTYKLGGGIKGRKVKKGDVITFLSVMNDLGRESVATYETVHRIDKHSFFHIFEPAKSLKEVLQSLYDAANWYGYAERKGKRYYPYQINLIAKRAKIEISYTPAQ